MSMCQSNLNNLYINSFIHYVKPLSEGESYHIYFLDKRFVTKNNLKLLRIAFELAAKYNVIEFSSISDLDNYYYKVISYGYINKVRLFEFFLRNKVIISKYDFIRGVSK